VRERIEAVRALESLGAAVHVASVDAGDAAAFGAFLDRYRAESWPPIRGVFHAAGAVDDRLIADLDESALATACGAKARGAEILDAAFADADLDFLVLFSSVGSVVGQAGQGAYAAANAFLDALAHARRARGQSALSINWGVWAETGLARTEGGRRTAAMLSQAGWDVLPRELALDVLECTAASGAAQLVVVPVDGGRVSQSGVRVPPLLQLVAAAESAPPAPAAARGMREDLGALPVAERRGRLEEILQGQVASVLKTAAARVERTRPLRALGIDSLMALELRRRLEAATGLSLSATLVWNYPNVAALAAFLAARLDLALDGEAQRIEPREGPVMPVPSLVGLSEDEALAALLRGGRGSQP
jgi:acyl carrier protein